MEAIKINTFSALCANVRRLARGIVSQLYLYRHLLRN